jgi:hypothetical protein
MKSRLFLNLRENLALFEKNGRNSGDIARNLNELFEAVRDDFSYASFELFQLYLDRAAKVGGDAVLSGIRSFLSTDFLETAFAKDPSDYGVALALGVKNLRLGNHPRAKQLIQRVAKSGYRERVPAEHLLRKHFTDVQK